MYLNKKNNSYVIAATTALITLAIIAAASSMATPATATTTTTSPAEGIVLSPQPLYQERSPPGNITPINETYGIFTFSGNGMLTLPNTTQTINTTHNGTAIISFATSSGYGKETIRTETGETATATLYEIVQFDPATSGGGKGIVTAVFQTNSTGMLAPLNGMIAAGIDEMTSSDESHITLWRWESGIPLSPSTTTSMEEPPLTNTTRTTNATDTDGIAAEDEGEQQQQQTTTIPPTPLLE
jgi:hypothetical protein